jgi:uncharacterized protein (TIGR02996 family)
MREREALLAAVCEAPDDDFIRQVFADWLDDHGDPDRADFIRLQLRLAGMGEDDPERPGLKQREAELWEAHKDAWQAEAPKWPGVSPGGHFVRGWPEWASCTGPGFVKHAAELARAIPLRVVRFEKLTARQCVKLAASPVLARLRDLDLYSHKIGDEGARAIFASPHLGGLASLSLNSTEITSEAVEALASSPSIKRLRKLDLSSNAIHDSGIADLASAGDWLPLREFKGWGMGLSPRVAAWFADAAVYSVLEVLEISQNWLGDEGVERLVRGTSGTWRTLDLGGNQIGDDGAEALARSPRLARLECLTLRDNPIGLRGVRALAASPHLAALRELELSDSTGFGDEGALAIARSPYLRLSKLYLTAGGFGPDGMEALARSPAFAGVRHLYVDSCRIGLRGVRALAAWPGLRYLETLFLSNCGVGDEGCAELMRQDLSGLTFLTLDDNGLTDAGAGAVLACPHLKGLTDLTMNDAGIGDEMVVRLRRHFGNVLFFYRPSVPDEDE